MQSSHAPFWIVIGDLHGRTDRLSAIPGTASAEGILITGDLTTAGRLQSHDACAVRQYGQARRGRLPA